MKRHARTIVRFWKYLTITALLIPGCRSKDGRYFVPNPFGPPIEVTDLIPPTIENIRPSNNIFLNDNGISFDAYDPPGAAGQPISGLDTSRIRALLSELNLPITRGLANTWNADIAAIANGLTTINLEVPDLAGNRRTASLTFRKDVNGPTVTFVGPTTGSSAQPTASINISGTYADPSGITTAQYFVRQPVNGQCVATGNLYPTGTGPGTVGQNRYELGINGTYNVNLALNAPSGMLPQTLSYCWQFHGEDGGRDRNDNARPSITDRFWKLDYTWLPPAPVVGSIGGTVRLNGSPLQGVVVTAAGQSQNTDANGFYLLTNISSGTHTVSLSNLPVGVQCLSQTASVTAGQATTTNFNCTQTNFTITLGLSYRHNGPGDSNTCVAISGALAAAGGSEAVALENIAGATYTVQWSGPGVVGTTQRTGTLNASSQALDRQPINLFGTYTANVSVTYQGVTKQASGTVTVAGMQGTCPQP